MIKIIVLSFIFGINAFAKTEKYKFESTVYFDQFYGHVHENPSNLSASITTIACGHPIAIYSKPNLKNEDWKFVKVAGEFGYIKTKYLTGSRPNCLQQKYPKFFQNLNLDLSELYYLGRILDQSISETTHAN